MTKEPVVTTPPSKGSFQQISNPVSTPIGKNVNAINSFHVAFTRKSGEIACAPTKYRMKDMLNRLHNLADHNKGFIIYLDSSIFKSRVFF